MISKLFVFIITLNFTFCTNTRRIVLGNPTLSDKGYMVYFLKSDKSENNEYDSWLCGGAIVSPTHILTAAACINDVSHLWVIAGYRKYVRSEYLEEDECTKNKKQRVIRTCTPKKYDFNYSNYTKWMAIDIGFAIVEKPYNFSDTTYRLRCSYVPKPIAINYEPTYTESERHMMIYGWGHSRGLRLPGDMTNYNSLYLQAASTKTVSKKYCMEFFKKEPLMNNTIAAYMICTIGAGNLDSEGNIIDPGVYNYNNGCSRKQMGVDGKCNHDYDSFESRRNGSGTMDNFNNTSGHQYNRTAKTNETRRRKIPTRRQGICTNDHGGPLVTWVGAKEMVVGIASSSLYDENYFCIAPSLYTSTHCVMRFLMCGMHMGNAKTKDGRRLCKNLKEEEGYELDERDVDWGGYTVKSNEKNNSKYSYGMSEKSNHQGDTQNLDQYTSDNPYREDAIDILEQDTDDLEAIVDVVDSY